MQDMPASEIAVLKQAAKDTPEAWVAIGMAVQWLVEQFGTSYGLSYDTVMSWITAAMVFAVARIGYKYFRKGTS